MSKSDLAGWIVRIVLFVLILTVGTLAALLAGETQGLALVDLAGNSNQAKITTAGHNMLYAGVVDTPQVTGIYRSDDNGQTWRIVQPGLAAPINTLVAQPGQSAVLFAGGAGGPAATTTNLWRSDDGGQTWRKFGLNLPANPAGLVPAITALAPDPQQPGVLYVGTAGQGVYRFNSETGYELLGDLSLRDVYIRRLDLGAGGRVYALTNRGLFATNGDKWQPLMVPELPVSLAVSPTRPDLLYAGGASNGVYRSTDGGQTWTAINAGLGLIPGASLRVTALAMADQEPQHVVAATAYGLGSQLAPAAIYESQDAGQHWTKLADIEALVTNLTVDGQAVFATSSQGVTHYALPGAGAGPAAAVITAKPAGNSSPVDLRPLANPTVTQAIILVLTIILAGLVLLGRIEWWVSLRRRRHSSGSQ